MKVTEPVELRKLRYGDIPEALRMAEDSLEEDPLQHYLRDTPDADIGLFREQWYLHLGVQLTRMIRKDRAWTIGNSDAMVSYIPVGEVEDDIDKIVKNMMPYFTAVTSTMLTNQQRQRNETFVKSFVRAVEDSIGDRIKDMFELAGLCTRPSMQGRGYGSALVRFVTALADEAGSATWLASSNISNTGFYEYLGFVTVATFTVGQCDPTWKEPPVVMKVMVREPRAQPPRV